MALLLFFSGTGTSGISGIINSFGEQSQGSIFVALGIEDRQLVKLDLSPGVQQVQKLSQRLCIGDSFVSLQSLKNKLVYDQRVVQSVCNIISDSIEGIQAVSQSICVGNVISIQKLLLEIAEKDSVLGQQKLLQSLKDMSVVTLSIDYDVFLDGVSIRNKITDMVVTYNEDSVHNSVEIRSIQSELFWDCDPAISEGISRIEVQIETRQMYFLLEKRIGEEQFFSFWGRSISAREDSPYTDDLEYSLDAPKSAKDIVEEILTISPLNWQCDDWILPTSFEFTGSPMEGIVQIAGVIGAVVRCEDDGEVLVRNKFPVRPIDMNSANAIVDYDRANLIRLDYDNTKGPGYNAIEVIGCTDSIDLPDIDIEEASPIVEQDVHIRVYWAGKKPSGIIQTYVTDGIITLLGEQTNKEEEETITFQDGISSVSKPITLIVGVEWIGDSGENITYRQYSKELEIEDEAYRIAKVIYETTYSRYRISGHDVEMLLALLSFGGESDVYVDIRMGAGNKIAPKLNRSLLTSQSIAVVAGTAWLDANRYNQKRIVLETSYNSNVVDGVLAYINDAEIDCVGNFHVKGCRIIAKGPRIINELEVVQCQV